MPRRPREELPPVQRHEDGPRPPRAPLGRGEALGRGAKLPGVRRLQGGAGELTQK